MMPGRRLQGLCFFSLFLLSGCGFNTSKYSPFWWPSSVPKELQSRLDEGNRLFMDGDYASSETVFLDLHQSTNQVVSHQAQYGLACSRFMLATKRQEYLDAIDTLEQWRQNSSADFEQGDPRMLLALFSKVLSTAPENNLKGEAPAEKHVLMQFLDHEQQIGELEKRLSDLKRQIEDLKRQRGTMQTMQAAMEAELVKLRQQLKTIETIDQEIQEKKQGIASP